MFSALLRENLIGFLVAGFNYLVISESSLYLMELLNISTSGVMEWLKVVFYALSMTLSFRLSWYIINQRIRIMRAKADILSAEAAERMAEAKARVYKLEKETGPIEP